MHPITVNQPSQWAANDYLISGMMYRLARFSYAFPAFPSPFHQIFQASWARQEETVFKGHAEAMMRTVQVAAILEGLAGRGKRPARAAISRQELEKKRQTGSHFDF